MGGGPRRFPMPSRPASGRGGWWVTEHQRSGRKVTLVPGRKRPSRALANADDARGAVADPAWDIRVAGVTQDAQGT